MKKYTIKKYFYSLIVLIVCFLFSSFSLVLIYPFKGEEPASKLPDENTQKLYAVINAFENYNAQYQNNTDPVIDKLANALASNILVDYDKVAESISLDSDSLTITARFIDAARVQLDNNIEFQFSAYNKYLPILSESAMKQIHKLVNDDSLYTKEYTINVSFSDNSEGLYQKAILNQDDIDNITEQYYKEAQRIYKDYINTSDVSTAFFCKSIKELSLDNILDIYNENNLENPITEEWQQELFINYSKHYLDSLIIQNIVKTNTSGTSSKGTIKYRIEDGNMTIDNVCNQLLDSYYANKQTPIEKLEVINDFSKELLWYIYNDTASLNEKSFDFTYSQNLNVFTVNDDFYKEIVNDIYEEFIKFENIFNKYYPSVIEQYFYVERPFAQTTTIADNTGESRYRQLDIKVTGSTDCFIKLYSYNTVTDTLNELMFVSYVKTGDSLQVFIPEGDYIFKYATGTMWYGDIHMFSDDGQYFASSNVISVHEYMMTTTIELGNFDSGSIPTYAQTPDIF